MKINLLNNCFAFVSYAFNNSKSTLTSLVQYIFKSRATTGMDLKEIKVKSCCQKVTEKVSCLFHAIFCCCGCCHKKSKRVNNAAVVGKEQVSESKTLTNVPQSINQEDKRTSRIGEFSPIGESYAVPPQEGLEESNIIPQEDTKPLAFIQRKGTLKTIHFNGHCTHIWIKEGVELKPYLETYFGLTNLDMTEVKNTVHINNTSNQPVLKPAVKELKFNLDRYPELFFDDHIIAFATTVVSLVESYNKKCEHLSLGYIDYTIYSLQLIRDNLALRPNRKALTEDIDGLISLLHQEWQVRIHQTPARSPLQKEYIQNRYEIFSKKELLTSIYWNQIKLSDNGYNDRKFHISICRGHTAMDGTILPDDEYVLRAYEIIIPILNNKKYKNIVTKFKFQPHSIIRSIHPKLDNTGFVDDKDPNVNLIGKEFVIYASSLNQKNLDLWTEMLYEIETTLDQKGIRSGFPSYADRPLHNSRFIETRSDKNFLRCYLGADELANLGMSQTEASQISGHDSHQEILSLYPVQPKPRKSPYLRVDLSQLKYDESDVDSFYQNLRKSLLQPICVIKRSRLLTMCIGSMTGYLHDFRLVNIIPSILELHPLNDEIGSRDVTIDEKYLSQPLLKAAKILAVISYNNKKLHLSVSNIAPAIYFGYVTKKIDDRNNDTADPFKGDIENDKEFVAYLVECALRTSEYQIRYAQPYHQFPAGSEYIKTLSKEIYSKLF